MRRRRSRVLGVVGLTVVVALWHLVAAGLGGAEAMVPFPFDVARAILERWHADDFGGNLLVSLSRVAVGFVVGASVGTVVGIISGWSLIAGRMLFVPLELGRYVPALAWVPLAILWFGLGEGSKVFLVSLGAFFQTLIGAYAGVRRVDTAVLQAARTLGCDGAALLWRVVVPAVLPDLATALRVGMTLSYITVVGAELLGADRGLGYLMMLGREDGRPELIFAGLALFAACNLGTEAGLRRVFDRLLRWHPGLEGVKA